LWVLGEFLKNQKIKDKFNQENPGENDLETFINFHNSSHGEVGERFSNILSNLQKSVKLYLNKSD